MNCTATLTTATVKPCPQDRPVCEFIGTSHCNGHDHVTLHTLTCVLDRRAHTYFQDEIEEHEGADPTGYIRRWRDNWEGATPHTPTLVADAEVEAAWATMIVTVTRDDMVRALEAAARVRKESA